LRNCSVSCYDWEKLIGGSVSRREWPGLANLRTTPSSSSLPAGQWWRRTAGTTHPAPCAGAADQGRNEEPRRRRPWGCRWPRAVAVAGPVSPGQGGAGASSSMATLEVTGDDGGAAPATGTPPVACRSVRCPS
jgi:hypothetical protein